MSTSVTRQASSGSLFDSTRSIPWHVVHAGVDAPFRDLLAKGVTRIAHVGASGVVWEFAKTLAHLAANRDPAAGAQTLSVKAYEVSTCRRGSTCGPGYHEGDGLDPKLDFVITAEHNHNEVTVPDSKPITFIILCNKLLRAHKCHFLARLLIVINIFSFAISNLQLP